jgi:hypothetical protein
MTSWGKQLTVILLTGTLGAAGYAYYQAQERQAATLTRITALETRLFASNQQGTQAARNIILDLSESVRRNRYQASSVAVLQQAEEIQSQTKAVIDTLHQLRQAWQTAGHRTELRQLPAQVNQYLLFIEKFLPDVPTQLASAGWVGDFDTTAEFKPATLALLTRLETQVRQVAAEALLKQSEKVVYEGSFDKLGAFAAPASATVASGQLYQARLALALATPSGRMHFSMNGQDLPTDLTNGQGVVQFSVPATLPNQPDTVRAQWQGRVQLPWGATDTLLEITVPYFIVKPSSR